MKKYPILLFLLTLSITITKVSFAQKQGQAYIDSLLVELPKALPDTNKVKLLGSLCFSYYPINPDEGIRYGNEGLQLAEKLQWKIWISKLNGNIGVNYAVKSEYSKALEYFLKAVKIGEETDDKANIATWLGNIANIYFLLSNYPMAIEYDLKALKINEEAKSKKGMAINLSNIGLIYKDQSDYSHAIEYFSRALKLNEEVGNKANQANNLCGVGIVYYKQENYDKALEYYTRAQRLYEEVGNKDGMAKSLQYIGVIYHEQSDNTKALDFLFKSLRLFKEVRNNVGTGTTFGDIGDAYLALFKDTKNTTALQQAKRYLDSAITIQGEVEDLKGLSISYNSFSEVQALLKDFKGAYEAHQKYKLLSDSIFNIEKDKKITQSTMQYDFDKKEALTKAEQEKKDAIAVKELQKQKLVRNGFVGGFAVVLLFAGVFFTQRNKISKGKKRSDELLLNILPSEVAEELKQKGSAEAKQYNDVTVMFTDFKDFTRISEKLSPSELVSEIHICFKAFDDIIGKFNIEKIKTIGDSYMCAGGLPVVNKTNATDVVNAATEIQQFMVQHLQQRKSEGREPFEIRIGIHTGTVVAGIVGVKKFAYDIWGDTVNIASRMESSGEAGKINISGSTYNLVKDKFTCVHRGKVQAKNKGEIDMYFVETVG